MENIARRKSEMTIPSAIPTSFSASGKLLLFGEYFVLSGSKALAIPLQAKQEMELLPYEKEGVLWQCFENGKCWLEIIFSSELDIVDTTDANKAEVIQKLLKVISRRKKTLKINHLHFKFTVNFNRNFGFGTSSTLISLLSQWTKINPYYLLAESFGGSGYDVAMATQTRAAVYTVKEKIIHEFEFQWHIANHLLFVYLGNKKSSAEAISSFKKEEVSKKQIELMNMIVQMALECWVIEDWELIMEYSELLLAPILKMPPVKELYFSDYPYTIKSLGGWGGDFIMATYRDVTEAKEYFKQKQKNITFTYRELVDPAALPSFFFKP